MALRFGIIGCGLMGRIHAENIRAMGHELVAASDLDRARAEAVAVGGQAYTDHREMLAAGGMDVVCVCNPTPHHHRAVLDCVEAGVHVFLEKPMAMTLAEAQEMGTACERAGLRLGLGFKMRHESVFATARELVAAGRIGTVRHSVFTFYQPPPPGERIWYADVGVLRDMLVHMVDLARWYHAAEVVTVRARTAKEMARAGEDKASLDLDFGSAGQSHIQGGYVPGFPDVGGREDIVCQLIGEGGYLVAKRPSLLLLNDRDGGTESRVSPANAFGAVLDAFVSALQAGDTVPVGARDGLAAQAVLEAATRSAMLDGAACPLVDPH